MIDYIEALQSVAVRYFDAPSQSWRKLSIGQRQLVPLPGETTLAFLSDDAWQLQREGVINCTRWRDDAILAGGVTTGSSPVSGRPQLICTYDAATKVIQVHRTTDKDAYMAVMGESLNPSAGDLVKSTFMASPHKPARFTVRLINGALPLSFRFSTHDGSHYDCIFDLNAVTSTPVIPKLFDMYTTIHLTRCTIYGKDFVVYF